MPGVLQYENDHPTEPTSEHPEDAILWLPSRLPASHRQTICAAGLPAIEEKLRIAQCTDALDSVRRILRIKSRMIQFKNKNLRGQRNGTRSRAVIDRVHERARASADKYRAARAARLTLSGPGKWDETFRVLEDGDIRGYQDANRLRPRKGRRGTLEDDQLENASMPPLEEAELDLFEETRGRRDGTGETRRTLSWIWTTNSLSAGGLPSLKEGSGVATGSTSTLASTSPSSTSTTQSAASSKKKRIPSSSANTSSSSHSSTAVSRSSEGADPAASLRDKSDDILRGEWARSRARAKRASEEVMLLKEEMGRVLRYLDWKGKWWMSAFNYSNEGVEDICREGMRAVASKNAELQQALRSSFQKLWTSPLEASLPEVGADGEKADADNEDDNDNDYEENEEESQNETGKN